MLAGEGVGCRVGVGTPVATLEGAAALEEPEADVRRPAGRVIAIPAEVDEQLVVLDVGARERVLDVALRRDLSAGPAPGADVVVVLRAPAEVDVVHAVEAVGDERGRHRCGVVRLDRFTEVGPVLTGHRCFRSDVAVDLEQAIVVDGLRGHRHECHSSDQRGRDECQQATLAPARSDCHSFRTPLREARRP